MQQRIGIIDLGSNTTRLIVMAYEPQRTFQLIDEVRATVRLAEGIGADGALQESAVQRALEALKLFATLCTSTGVQQVVAVGTSAVRDATNQAAFLHALKQETGLDMRILSEEQEAYYGYLGVINSLPVEDGFVIDIGGGSTEISQMYQRGFQRWFSQPVGVVRFTERYVKSDPVSGKDFRALKQGVSASFASLDWLQAAPGRTLVGIGGTVRNLGRIDQKRRAYPLERLHGYILTRKALDAIVAMLRKHSLKGRSDIPGLNQDRADVIMAGAVILQQLLEQSGFTQIMIGGQGLREGLFYEHFLADCQMPLFDDLRTFSIRNLAYRFDCEIAHAEQVRKLSLQLFDQLQPLHGYGDWERELLAHAALLHDIGLHIGYYDHHKHSGYILANAAPPGFTQREIALLVILVRSHRKGSVPISEYYTVLEPGDDERANRLAALLRLAEQMEESKSQVVRRIDVQFEGNLVRLCLHVTGDARVELWNVNQRTALFKRAFGRDLEAVEAVEAAG